jgi:hypothetical protein
VRAPFVAAVEPWGREPVAAPNRRAGRGAPNESGVVCFCLRIGR